MSATPRKRSGGVCGGRGAGIGAARRVGIVAAGGVVAAALASGCLFLAPRPDVPPGRFVERTVVLSLEGTPGLAFEGSYGTPSRSTTARGVVPSQFSVTTSVAVVASFAKAAAEGELVVRVLVDGQELQRRSTTAPFGTVIITHRF
jgi:hypothetical protein